MTLNSVRPFFPRARIARAVVALALLLAVALPSLATAQGEDDLLPVDKAFQIDAHALASDSVRIDFKLTPHYYLYRDRIKVSTRDASVTLGALALPEGEKKHDEYLGDVVVYHANFSATQPLIVPAGATEVVLQVRYQGCHEVDPKICFPPHTTPVTVKLPAAGSDAAAKPDSALAALPSSGATPLALGGNAEPLPVEKAFVFDAIAAGPRQLLARVTMPKSYYLYRDKTHFSSSDAKLEAPAWPAGIVHRDESFGETTVYFNEVAVPVSFTPTDPKATSVHLEATLQGCLEGAVCYPPSVRKVEVMLAGAATAAAGASNASGATASAPASGAGSASASADSADGASASDSTFSRALSGSLWVTFTVFFLAGLGLAFTPCVFPMIPILSGIIAGAGENLSTRRAIVLSVVYVLASAVVFTLAGVVAGLAGKNLQAAFQTPWVLCCFAGLFVLLALSMFGFYELQLPGSWQNKLTSVSNTQSGGSLAGVAVMGALSALIVGPCVTPPLAVAVLYIAQKHDALLGGFALFTLALGMGAPLVVFGASAGRFLPRAGAWMDAVKAVFGVVFLGLAIWMLSRILDAGWVMLATGVLAVASAVYLGALERLPEGASGWRALWKSLGVVLLVIGAAELIGAAAGAGDVLQPLRGVGASAGGSAAAPAGVVFKRIKSGADVDRELAAANAAGKPAVLDFYADWCVACKEMEKYTFSRGDVRDALAGFVLLQADVTANDDVDQALMARYAIIAPPDTLFFGHDGAERRRLRLTGEEDADKFLKRVAQAQ